ncbi:hypothetical protein NW767_006598 [Fusarium falciforme]|nr:hypothetical protein NW767_006598 [Fusarium falciforme]
MSDNDSQISRDVPIYGRLDPQRSQIRLLEMDETVSGADWKLSVVSLEDKPRFTALSYAWGTSEENEEIRLNGKVVPIKGNLAYALRPVYQHWVDAFPDKRSRQMFLWADALCIDQNDVEEKSSQVPLMGTIFSRAELVMCWLGQESDSLYCALDTIEMLYSEWSEKDDISDLRWILHHPSLCDVWTDERDDSWINTRWEAMYEFTRLGYWHRTWVFQEIVLAKRVRAICGRKALEWHKIAEVAEQASELNLALQTRGMMKPEFLSGPAWVALATHHSPPWILLQTYAETGRMEATRDTARHEPDWYLSVLGGRRLLATDPKDHIYGLLGVTRLPIIPDYSEKTSVASLYCDYVAKWLKAWRDGDMDFEELDFITFSGFSTAQKDLEMPSWAPNYPSASGSGGADGRLICRGSASEQVFPKDTEDASVIGMSLFVSGVELDIITQTEDCDYEGAFSVPNFNFLQKFVMRRSVYPTGISSLQAMFRILSRGGYGGYEPLDATGLRMVTCVFRILNQTLERGEIDTTPRDPARVFELFGVSTDSAQSFASSLAELLASPSCTPYDQETPLWLSEWYQDLRETGKWKSDDSIKWQTIEELCGCRGLAFFTTGSGYIGISRKGAQVGDRICVIKGSRALMILRPGLDKSHHVHVSTCCVVGLSHGEARGHLDSGRAQVSRFEIR